jgi:two-component system OmpR family sensor kinase
MDSSDLNHRVTNPSFQLLSVCHTLDWMLRTKLLLAFLGLLAPAVVMGSLLYWGPRQIEQRLDRSLLAHNEVQLYLTLALQIYRDLQRLSHEVLLGQPVREEEVLASRRRLDEQLASLRQLTLEELAFVGTKEPEEREELARIDRFAWLAHSWAAVLTEGASPDLTSFRSRIDVFDQELGVLIDDVITDETSEAEAADSQTRALMRQLTRVAVAVVLMATICAILTALWARRRIQAPIEALRQATLRLAGDGLDHRVHVSGRDELADLGMSFNWMAAELQRRRAELDQARIELEREVHERTRELHESNQALRRMDEARRRMFANISHALRTPLTVIRGEAEVTLRSRDTTGRGTRAALEQIVETTTQVNKLVEDLLTVARSEALAPRAEITVIAAGELLRDVAEAAGTLGSAKRLQVDCSVPDRPIDICGDPDRLREALLILVDNACRYTQAGGRIAIRLTADGARAVLSVADSGVGIPPDELDFVADRFYRGSNIGHLSPSGTGLGLHIAKSIVEAHGGEIEIASEREEGTCVTVRMPLCREHAPGTAPGTCDERAAG